MYVFISLVTDCVLLKLGLDTYYWTAVNQFFLWGSLSVYFAITFTMYSNGMFLIFTSSFPFIGESPAIELHTDKGKRNCTGSVEEKSVKICIIY